MTLGDGKSSSREIQQRLFRGRWRNAGIPRKRRSHTSGMRSHRGGVRLFGGEALTFHWRTYTVARPTTDGGWLGSQLKLDQWLVAYYEEVTLQRYYLPWDSTA